MLVGSIAGVLVFGQVFLLFMHIQEEKFGLLTFILLYVTQLLSAGLYMFYHMKTKQLKKQENWEAHVKTVYVTDLSVREKNATLSSIFLHFLLL